MLSFSNTYSTTHRSASSSILCPLQLSSLVFLIFTFLDAHFQTSTLYTILLSVELSGQFVLTFCYQLVNGKASLNSGYRLHH